MEAGMECVIMRIPLYTHDFDRGWLPLLAPISPVDTFEIDFSSKRSLFVTQAQQSRIPDQAVTRRSAAPKCRQRNSGFKPATWVTNQTGRRYETGGVEALVDRSRAPHSHPHAVAPEMVQLLMAARKKHPRWGPKKTIGHREAPAPASRVASGKHGWSHRQEARAIGRQKRVRL
jgi:hypothetical protein